MRERIHPSPVPRWQSAAAKSQPGWQSMLRLTETTEFESTHSHNTGQMPVFPASADEISTFHGLLFRLEDGCYTILSAGILVSMHRSKARLVRKDAYRPREPAINDDPSPTKAQAYKESDGEKTALTTPMTSSYPSTTQRISTSIRRACRALGLQ